MFHQLSSFHDFCIIFPQFDRFWSPFCLVFEVHSLQLCAVLQQYWHPLLGPVAGTAKSHHVLRNILYTVNYIYMIIHAQWSHVLFVCLFCLLQFQFRCDLALWWFGMLELSRAASLPLCQPCFQGNAAAGVSSQFLPRPILWPREGKSNETALLLGAVLLLRGLYQWAEVNSVHTFWPGHCGWRQTGLEFLRLNSPYIFLEAYSASFWNQRTLQRLEKGRSLFRSHVVTSRYQQTSSSKIIQNSFSIFTAWHGFQHLVGQVTTLEPVQKPQVKGSDCAFAFQSRAENLGISHKIFQKSPGLWTFHPTWAPCGSLGRQRWGFMVFLCFSYVSLNGDTVISWCRKYYTIYDAKKWHVGIGQDDPEAVDLARRKKKHIFSGKVWPNIRPGPGSKMVRWQMKLVATWGEEASEHPGTGGWAATKEGWTGGMRTMWSALLATYILNYYHASSCILDIENMFLLAHIIDNYDFQGLGFRRCMRLFSHDTTSLGGF